MCTEKTEVIREITTEKQMKAVEESKRQYDKGKLRKFEEGDLVLERIAGLDSKLQESWRAPHKVLECSG